MAFVTSETVDQWIQRLFPHLNAPIRNAIGYKLERSGDSDIFRRNVELAYATTAKFSSDHVIRVIDALPEVSSPLRINPIHADGSVQLRYMAGHYSPDTMVELINDLIHVSTFEMLRQVPVHRHSELVNAQILYSDTTERVPGREWQACLDWVAIGNKTLTNQRAWQILHSDDRPMINSVIQMPVVTETQLRTYFDKFGGSYKEDWRVHYAPMNPNCPPDLARDMQRRLHARLTPDVYAGGNFDAIDLLRFSNQFLMSRNFPVIAGLLANPRNRPSDLLSAMNTQDIRNNLPCLSAALSNPASPVTEVDKQLREILSSPDGHRKGKRNVWYIASILSGHPDLPLATRQAVLNLDGKPFLKSDDDIQGLPSADGVNWFAMTQLHLDNELLQTIELPGIISPPDNIPFSVMDKLAEADRISLFGFQSLIDRGGRLAAWAASTPENNGFSIDHRAEALAKGTLKAVSVMGVTLPPEDHPWPRLWKMMPGLEDIPETGFVGVDAMPQYSYWQDAVLYKVDVLNTREKRMRLPEKVQSIIEIMRTPEKIHNHVLARVDTGEGGKFLVAWQLNAIGAFVRSDVWDFTKLSDNPAERVPQPYNYNVISIAEKVAEIWTEKQMDFSARTGQIFGLS